MKQKEIVEEPVVQEKNKRNKLIILLFAVLICFFVYYGYTKIYEDNNNNSNYADIDKNESTIEKVGDEQFIAIDNGEKIIIYDEEFNKVWEHTLEDQEYSINSIKFDINFLYYVEGNNLNRVNIDTQKKESLNINLEGFSDFYVNGNDLIYLNYDKVVYVDLTNKTNKNLDVKSENNVALINGKFYYSERGTSKLIEYNISSNNKKVIDEDARIDECGKNHILFVNSKNEYVLYNTLTNTKEIALTADEYAYSSGASFPISIFDGKVYIFKDLSLSVIDAGKTKELYKYQLKKDEHIGSFYMINSNKVLLSISEYEETFHSCSNDVCAPESIKDKIYIVDISKKSATEITSKFNEDFILFEKVFLNK